MSSAVFSQLKWESLIQRSRERHISHKTYFHFIYSPIDFTPQFKESPFEVNHFHWSCLFFLLQVVNKHDCKCKTASPEHWSHKCGRQNGALQLSHQEILTFNLTLFLHKVWWMTGTGLLWQPRFHDIRGKRFYDLTTHDNARWKGFTFCESSLHGTVDASVSPNGNDFWAFSPHVKWKKNSMKTELQGRWESHEKSFTFDDNTSEQHCAGRAVQSTNFTKSPIEHTLVYFSGEEAHMLSPQGKAQQNFYPIKGISFVFPHLSSQFLHWQQLGLSSTNQSVFCFRTRNKP